MPDWHISTPVVLLIFNRPDTTLQVFEQIRRARPPRLLIVADGPRPEYPGEIEQCASARAVVDAVDWECEVLKNYADMNLGCRRRVASGLDWVFARVDEAIILEDDCVPDPSFFRFCEDLLAYYRHDEHVMSISGDNFQAGQRRTEHSYYFSRYHHLWGWATWRHAWQYYDNTMAAWPALERNGWLEGVLADSRLQSFWRGTFQSVYEGRIDTWDFQWLFACWVRNGLCVLPEVNLVSNVGFGAGATHTRSKSPLAALPTEPMDFPLSHPLTVARHAQADALTEKIMFNGHSVQQLRNRIRRVLPSWAQA